MGDYGYGLWVLVIINSAIFILFALSFFHPANRRDWKAMGAFSAFIVALFTEMYGFPLTIYLLTGVFGSKIGGVNLTHNSGHLWSDIFGWNGDPHFSPFHLASYVLIGGGFGLIAAAWRVLWAAANRRELAVTGAYARVRHPQYAGFLAVMVGFLLQWPTLPTLIMFPFLVAIYRRLAIAEEKTVRAAFGATWDAYAAITPRFIPRLRSRQVPPLKTDVQPLPDPAPSAQRAGAPKTGSVVGADDGRPFGSQDGQQAARLSAGPLGGRRSNDEDAHRPRSS